MATCLQDFALVGQDLLRWWDSCRFLFVFFLFPARTIIKISLNCSALKNHLEDSKNSTSGKLSRTERFQHFPAFFF